jgi:molybdopterin-guanine dinucleotide biosynthesis protein A
MGARAATTPRDCYNRPARRRGGDVTLDQERLDRSAVEAFILVGGQSRRMGTDKARLMLHGVSLLATLAQHIAPAVARVRVVGKPGMNFDDLGLTCLVDDEAETALVHGLRAALAAPGPPWRWVLACDMPDIDAGMLHGLWSAAAAARTLGSAPRLAGRTAGEPLPSLWHRDVLAAVRPEWGMAARNWVTAAGLALWDVPPADTARFQNVNTPEAWESYLAAHAGGGR